MTRAPALGSQRLARRRAALRARIRKLGFYAGRVLSGLLVVMLVVVMALAMAWPPINRVEAGQTPQYPDIQPVAWSLSQSRVWNGVREVVAATDGWTEVGAHEGSGTVDFEARSRSRLFVDDVHVRVEPNGEGGSVVFAVSASRVGRGDFGQNARTLRRLFAALHENLGASVDEPSAP